VLLLLYLALDDGDGRPLIIDQPEENLDPKSVFEKLVTLFVEAKWKRQVIMVTHNANLVINTDADQIIVVQSRPHPHGALPPISYVSGGLENAGIDVHRLGGNLAVNAVLFRLRTYLAVLESSCKYLKYIKLCVVAKP
jgi:energy-coupling factor transporter ATP-binding protein EcfA2